MDGNRVIWDCVETEDSKPAGAAKRRRSRRRVPRGGRSEVSAATRVEILKSAAAAFRKLGYHGATVEQIAAALRMKKGNLYYYFRNKEEILFACHEYSHDRLQELLDQVVRSTAPPDAKLRRLIVSTVHVILDELHGTALLLDLEALTPAHLKAVIVRRDRFDRGMRMILEWRQIDDRVGVDAGSGFGEGIGRSTNARRARDLQRTNGRVLIDVGVGIDRGHLDTGTGG